ncbi:MAG: hypothetical protein KTM48_08535 [Wolbachia endosymbiont of Pissodes strobi]|nr:hypothetical protein [Wolbachia endosymbiont of Pissodes strobi]
MDFSVIRVADTGSLYNGITAVLRHTAAVSLDPANKQRDDGCQASTPMMSSQCLTLGSRRKNGVMKVAEVSIQKGVVPVPRLLGSRKLNSTLSKCTIRTRFQTGMTAVLRHTAADRSR